MCIRDSHWIKGSLSRLYEIHYHNKDTVTNLTQKFCSVTHIQETFLFVERKVIIFGVIMYDDIKTKGFGR